MRGSLERDVTRLSHTCSCARFVGGHELLLIRKRFLSMDIIHATSKVESLKTTLELSLVRIATRRNNA